MILASDLHLRRTRPRSRKDDYFSTQEKKFRFILELAQESPPLVVPGDIFHIAKPGEALLRWVIDLLMEYDVRPIVVPGQHDLPSHNLNLLHESGLGVLASADLIDLLTDGQPYWLPDNHHNTYGLEIYIHGYPYGTIPDTTVVGLPGVLLWHHMVINEPLWPGQLADKANSILRKYKDFDLIVTGDNHQSFAISETDSGWKVERDGRGPRWLVNPGSMMRMTASQVDYQPCVYKYENWVVKRIPLPIEEDVFDLSELEQAKEKDSRIQAFIEKLGGDWEFGLSFEKNLEEFLIKNKVDDRVKEIIWRCLE